MGFENFNFNSEEHIELPKEDYLEAAREESLVLLEKYDFVNEEEIDDIVPKEDSRDIPILFFSGFGATPETQEDSLIEISRDEGRRVLAVPVTRKRIIDEDSIIPSVELQKSLAGLEVLQKKGIEKVDAIGHSQGGLNLAIAAMLFPEKFRSVVFIAPAGMIEGDSPLSLVKRFLVDEGIQEVRDMDKFNMGSIINYMKGLFKYSFENPMVSIDEITALASMDIFEISKKLKEKGVNVGFVCGANDKVFPIEEVLKNIGKDNTNHFISTKGNHGSIIFNKEHAQLASNLLTNMKR